MRRMLTLSATLLLLWVLVAQLNHVLTGWHTALFVGGLYVAFSALTQPMRAGLGAALVGGLICDANSPADVLGIHTLFFAAAHLTIFNVRDRVAREDTPSRVVVALLANLALFLAFSFTQIGQSPSPAAAWPRLLMDLVVSQVFLALVAPWFFALQERSLLLTGVDRESLA